MFIWTFCKNKIGQGEMWGFLSKPDVKPAYHFSQKGLFTITCSTDMSIIAMTEFALVALSPSSTDP